MMMWLIGLIEAASGTRASSTEWTRKGSNSDLHIKYFGGDKAANLNGRAINDCGDLRFMSALRASKRRVAYSNVAHDKIVGWRTSSIRRESELRQPSQLQSLLHNRYPHIVNVENENDDIHGTRVAASNQCYTDPEEEEMLGGLTQVPWQRIDVSFQNSKYVIDYTKQSYDQISELQYRGFGQVAKVLDIASFQPQGKAEFLLWSQHGILMGEPERYIPVYQFVEYTSDVRLLCHNSKMILLVSFSEPLPLRMKILWIITGMV